MTTVKPANARYASLEQALLAGMALLAVAWHVFLRFTFQVDSGTLGLRLVGLPLVLALALGCVPLVLELLLELLRREFGSDSLAGISQVTSVLLGVYLARAMVGLVLSGGQTSSSADSRCGGDGSIAALAVPSLRRFHFSDEEAGSAFFAGPRDDLFGRPRRLRCPR